MSWTPAKIKFGPGVCGDIRGAVVQGVPLRVGREIERDAVDPYVVKPDVTGAIPGLQYGQEAEVSNVDSILAVIRQNFAARRCAVQAESKQTPAASTLRIVDQLP